MGKPAAAGGVATRVYIPEHVFDLDVFCVLDYSGIEVRFLAQMSGDPLLISQFNDGFDVHSLVGTEMTGWAAEKIKEDEKTRRIVKNIHFGIIYGVSREGVYPYLLMKGVFDPTAPPAQVAKDKKLSMMYYDRYFARYKKVKALIDKLRADGEAGFVETMFGFRRAITDEDSGRKTYSGNQSVNTPIQGSAHTLMLICMALLAMKPKTYTLLQRPVMEVHDALYFLSKLRDLKSTYALAIQLMEKDAPAYATKHFGIDFKVPIKADAKAGFTLGSLVNYSGQEPEAFLPQWREYFKKTSSAPLSDLAA